MKKTLSRWGQRFGLGRAIGLLLLFVFLGIRVWDPPPLQELRLRSFDLYQVLHPRAIDPRRPVAIVDIDENSLRAYGQWPWARTRVAELINKLTSMGAAIIGFDVVFAEPDRLSPGMAADSFANLDDATREKLRTLPSNDDVFAAAIRKSRVVLGQSGITAWIDQGDLSTIPRTTVAWKPFDPTPWLVQVSALVRQHASPGKSCGRSRSLQHRSGARWHCPPRSGRHGGWRADYASIESGNAARWFWGAGDSCLDRRRQGSKRCRPSRPAFSCRPTTLASCGCISADMRRTFMCPQKTCSTGVSPRPCCRQVHPDRNVGNRFVGYQDDAGRSGNAGCRGPCPGHRGGADRIALELSVLREGGRTDRRVSGRSRDRDLRADDRRAAAADFRELVSAPGSPPCPGTSFKDRIC